MKLLVVESPNKAKKIRALLGSGWRVEASVGHVRDLPEREMGVAPPAYSPDYVVIEGKEDVIRRLERAVTESKEVFLGTDPDREGEAIAWHLKELLAPVLGGKLCYRVRFSEVTRSALERAVAAREGIDVRRVAAQEARRVIDRLVGYQVSPRLGRGRSAGRVQSPALALVVDRERERRAHRAQVHHAVVAEMTLPAPWSASWDFGPFLAGGAPYWTDRTVAEVIAGTRVLRVVDLAREEASEPPPAPFTTSTLQQVASGRLRLSPEETMAAAQRLFEAGAITYHRTDNPNVADEANVALQGVVRALGLPLADRLRRHPAKGGAQEAHEAIRPVDSTEESAGATEDEQALYRLIRERALASVMPDAVYEVTQMVCEGDVRVPLAGTPPARFVARGRVLTERAGWRALAPGKPAGKDDEVELPAGIEVGEAYPCAARVVDKKTEPRARYTEAALVRALERLEIGRPSTYASILANLKRRGYVTLRGRALEPTEAGEQVIDALRGAGFRFLDPGYTRDMESRLDQVAAGALGYRAVVSEADADLQVDLARLPEPAPAARGGPVEGARCRCGGAVRESPRAWQCEICGAIVWKEIAKKAISARQGLAILSGRTVALKGLKSRRTGKTFSARAALAADGKRVDLVFED